jgi:hypothetical protein
MRHAGIAFIILLFIPLSGTTQIQKSAHENTTSVIDDLLQFPAPEPNNSEEDAQSGRIYPGKVTPPPDDAPMDALTLYWKRADANIQKSLPKKMQDRLLEACIQKPELLDSLVNALPQTPEALNTIKRLYDENVSHFDEGWREAVHHHLKFTSKHFIEELVADALAAKDDNKSGSVGNADELEALAQLDWAKAEPILKNFAADAMLRRAVLSKTLLFQHYNQANPNGTELFKELKNIVENRRAPGYARDRAAETLLSFEWSGRDAWFLDLFRDPTLRNLLDGYTMRCPLAAFVGKTPDHWIPIVTKMIGNSNRAVHDNAVECLIQFHLRDARKDALTPLLPWLLNSKWSSASDRLRLIQSVADLDIRESVPGLIAALNQNEDEAERAYAAEALIHFRDPRAIPELRKGMPSISAGHYRQMFIAALIASGGLSDKEAAADIEAYAAIACTKDESALMELNDDISPKSPIPVSISIGRYLAEREAPSEGAIFLLLERAASLDSSNLSLATFLRDIAHRWPSINGDRDIALRIQDQKASAKSIRYVLERRNSFSKNCADEISKVKTSAGSPAGFFAVLASDTQWANGLLKGSDKAAITALLASARLVRDALPLDLVDAQYKSGDSQLEKVAGAYLIAEDSPRARELFSAQSKGLKIIGARQDGGDPGHHSYSDFDEFEKQLISLMSGDGASDEVYALLTAGYWGDAGQTAITRKGDEFTLTFYDTPGRRYKRSLKKEEFETLTSFISSRKVDDLGPLSQGIADGMQYEYVHLTQSRGRRVFMNNPGLSKSGGSIYDNLCGLFKGLVDSERFSIDYFDLSKLPGFEILFADHRFLLLDFWKEGDSEKYHISPDRDRGNEAKAFANLGSIQITSGTPKSKDTFWASINEGTMTEVSAPPLFPPANPNLAVPAEFDESNKDYYCSPLPMLSVGTSVYREGTGENHTKKGFWKFEPEKAPALLVSGNVSCPAISANGKWALLAKVKGTWANPNILVRVNLTSGEELNVHIPEADTLTPIAYIPELQRFLAYRAKDDPDINSKPVGPATSEYWLVDPETGKGEITTAEVRPLTHAGARPLQPKNASGEYWAAIPSGKADGTDIGIFDAKALRFIPQMHVPGIHFDSQALWIDEPTQTAYVVYQFQLLRFLLSSPPEKGVALFPRSSSINLHARVPDAVTGTLLAE